MANQLCTSRLKSVILKLALLVVFAPTAWEVVHAQTEITKRKAYLEQLRLIRYPHPTNRPRDVFSSFERLSYRDSTWDDWQQRTGELPPDFEKKPVNAFLPDPLMGEEQGREKRIVSLADWDKKRIWIREQVKHLLSGTFPPPPDKLHVKILSEREENGIKIQLLELRFGEQEAARLTLELLIPPGEGPFPVFMSQWNHRVWAKIAVRRGYIGCLYAGADIKDDTEPYQKLYPEYDWTILMTRAWGAQRAVDYLYTRAEVNKQQIALAGHSRNAKQSLFAAAFDPRITAVISSSGGTGGEIPYRYTDERYDNESIDFLCSIRPQWLHPRLRFYAGREHQLPIDQNSLMALIAPNALLLSSSVREGGGGDPWAIEQNYKSVKRVYEFLGVPDHLGVRFRDGGHSVSARDIEAYVDWLDIQFDRRQLPWENRLVYDYSFDKWKKLSGERINPDDFPTAQPFLGGKKTLVDTADWSREKSEIQKQIQWLLGEEAPGLKGDPLRELVPAEDYLSKLIDRPVVRNGKKQSLGPYSNAVGDNLFASLYYPIDESGNMNLGNRVKLPVVIFLHDYGNTGFGMRYRDLFEGFLSQGVAVLALDLLGYGERIDEGTLFYERYPRWSKLGKMVADTRAAIDAAESLDFIDSRHIYIAGYALGGTVGLFTAALDERVTGIAAVSAFTPFRDTQLIGRHEGVLAFSHLHGLLPRLGFFVGREDRIPVDFNEIVAAIAPRPVWINSPALDRHVNPEALRKCVDDARGVYQIYRAEDALSLETPLGFNRFTGEQQKEMVRWVSARVNDSD